MKYLTLTAVSAFALVLAACGGDKTKPQDNTAGDEAAMAQPDEAAGLAGALNGLIERKVNNSVQVQMSISNPERPEADVADDAARKPGEVLQFAGVAPGMTVIELEAGRGYYTEILSRIVGTDGKVVMINPPSFDVFFEGGAMIERLGEDGNRLGNVVHSRTLFDALDVADGSADMVTWMLGPHELFFTMQDGSQFGDPETAYSEIFRVLKPGGVFIALDHAAAEGAPETTGGTTHRIDPNTVRVRAVNAGLVQIDASDILANSDDKYDVSVFDPSVRRKTDRFIHLYKKPAN